VCVGLYITRVCLPVCVGLYTTRVCLPGVHWVVYTQRCTSQVRTVVYAGCTSQGENSGICRVYPGCTSQGVNRGIPQGVPLRGAQGVPQGVPRVYNRWYIPRVYLRCIPVVYMPGCTSGVYRGVYPGCERCAQQGIYPGCERRETSAQTSLPFPFHCWSIILLLVHQCFL